jgi:hypothetical protein
VLEDNIIQYLNLWKDNDAAFRDLVKKSPVLEEAAKLSENLSRISEKGLEAISIMKHKSLAPAGWKDKCLEVTEKAKEQGGRCDLQVVTAIEELIETAAGRSEQK